MAIQQHPIPQNVTQFQFKLVGDMTLKQFLELAGGIVVAVIIYAFPLPVFFKWPLMAVAAGLGAGMAFVPVEGRPLDQWLIAFVRSIYQPTIYVWKKSGPSSEEATPRQNPLAVTTLTPKEPAKQIAPAVTAVNHGAVSLPSTQNIPVVTGGADASNVDFSTITTPPSTPKDAAVAPPVNKVQTIFQKVDYTPIKIEHQTPVSPAAPAPITATPIVAPPTTPAPAQPTPTVAAPKQLLPIPHPPQTPNTIVGMTLTPGGSILDSAIIEITLNKATVRATKSNKLGQFLFAKPLDNGLYQITAERQGYTFPTYSLNLTGAVVQPIALKATSETNGSI